MSNRHPDPARTITFAGEVTHAQCDGCDFWHPADELSDGECGFCVEADR